MSSRREKQIALDKRREERKKLLEEKRNIEKLKAKERQRRQRKAEASRGRKAFVGIVLLLVLVFAGTQLYSAYKINSNYKKILAENRSLREEKEALEEELNHVNEPEYVEQQAREQLKMIKPGEVMYILPQKEKEEGQKEKENE